jgi:hypothetical protein
MFAKTEHKSPIPISGLLPNKKKDVEHKHADIWVKKTSLLNENVQRNQ